MLDMNLRYLSREKDRKGDPRYFARRYGRRVAVPGTPGTPDFLRAFAAALERLSAPDPARRSPAVKTLGWLVARYFESAEFQALDETSQRNRRAILKECLAVVHKATGETMEACPLVKFNAAKVKTIRDDKKGKPGAANNRRKYLSAMCGWAVEAGHLKANPVRDVRQLKRVSKGFHTWSIEEVAQFESIWPVGSKPRLALALMLYLGVRRSDLVRLGPGMVAGNVLSLVPAKTRYSRADVSRKPILPVLAEIIAASPTGATTYIETEYGKPFTAAGFGNWFREVCDKAGLPHCSAHGLRKAGATLAADNGATIHQLMALYDWTSPKQAAPYTIAADRKRLAAQAAALISG